MAESIKVGLKQETQRGLCWNVHYLPCADEEAREFLNEEQHAHAVDQLRALASEAQPARPTTVRVDAIEDLYELKDKGGILGRINVRIFFTVCSASRSILVLGATKKEEDGPTPVHMKVRIRSRLRRFRAGHFGPLP